MKHKSSRNWIRFAMQCSIIAVIVLFLTKVIGKGAVNPESYCPMGGLETLASYLVRETMACSMTTVQIMMGLGLGIAIMLFGKLFCSHICPLGFVNELMMRLRKALKIKKFSIRNGSAVDFVLRFFKYALLFVVFYMTVSSSELFCKNFDPYYAAATGFKGEITVWMVSVALGLFFLGGLFVDMFWCRYICPLGAASTIFKFTVEFLAVVALFIVLSLVGINVPWVVILAVICVMGYLLEILVRKPKVNTQLISIRRDEGKCNGCGLCEKRCPYHIDIAGCGGKVTCPDCMLCGECVKACNTEALTLGKKKTGLWLPAVVAIALFGAALYFGNKTEIPTINVKWNDPETVSDSDLKTFTMEGLNSVKCYGSSMAFKAKLERVPGAYGVKTFVKHHKVVILYDPSVTSEDKIREAVYTPTTFRISDPEKDVKKVKVITIRTEKMYDRMSPNYLGLQIRNTGRKYYGLSTEYDCPLKVHLYMDLDEPIDEAFLKEMVSMKALEMPIHGGGTKVTPVDFKFVKLEEQVDTMEIRPYLELVFSPFKAEFKSRVEKYAGRPQQTMSFSDMKYEKPLTKRNLPYLSNYLSQHDGLIGVYLLLDEENLPTIRIRYCTDDLSAEKILELVNQPKWTIKYKEGDVREESARFHFYDTGKVEKYNE